MQHVYPPSLFPVTDTIWYKSSSGASYSRPLNPDQNQPWIFLFLGVGGLCSQLLFSFLSLLRCFFPGSVLRGHKYDHLSWVDLSCKTCNCESFSKYVVFVSKFQTRWESEGEFCTLRFDVSILDGERTQRKPKRKSLLPRGGTYNW